MMIDKNNAEAAPIVEGGDPEATDAPGRKQRQPRRTKPPTEPVHAASKANTTKLPSTRARTHNEEERAEKLKRIETLISQGASAKAAIRDAGISEQTYYQWRRAAKPAAEAAKTPAIVDDELAEFVRLDQENKRLRKLLAEKLRAENAELRKRLGLD